MAIDFPNSPTTGDTYTVNGRTWKWDGTTWAAYGNYPDPTVFKVDTTSGYVGINNVSPTVALDVTGSAVFSGSITVDGDFTVSGTTTTVNTTELNVEDNIVTLNYGVTGTPSLDAGIEVERGDETNAQLLWDESAGAWVVNSDFTVDTDTLHVDSTNNRVGIGTTSPSSQFQVDGGASGAQARITASGADTSIAFLTENQQNWSIGIDESDAGKLKIGESVNVGTVTRVTIDSSGNVGIGTNSPDTNLHIQTANNTMAHFESTDAEALIGFSDSNSTGNWYDRRLGAVGNNLVFVAGNNTRMTIDSSGNVGIGTTTPGYSLEVNDEITLKGTIPYLRLLETTGSSDVHIWLGQDGSSNEGLHTWYQSATGHSYIDNIFSTGNLYLRTNNGSNSNLTLRSNGDTVVQYDKAISFSRDTAASDLTTFIKGGNNPDGGYSSGDQNYWVHLSSKGGTIVTLNTDGSATSPRNNFDHFSIYQAAPNSTSGRRLFSVNNIGDVQFGNAGVRIDRGWANYPSITVQTDNAFGTANTSYAEFRVHGISWTHAEWVGGASGADFSTNFRIDGTTYVSSDQRHKTNIIDNPYGLSTILQLQPRKFDRINSLGEVEQNNTNILGFIAQEVIEVLPEAVNYYPDEDTPNDIGWCRAYSLSESYIVSTLVNAVKELSAKNDLLEERIAALEAN